MSLIGKIVKIDDRRDRRLLSKEIFAYLARAMCCETPDEYEALKSSIQTYLSPKTQEEFMNLTQVIEQKGREEGLELQALAQVLCIKSHALVAP